jgi:hypothetical protein
MSNFLIIEILSETGRRFELLADQIHEVAAQNNYRATRENIKRAFGFVGSFRQTGVFYSIDWRNPETVPEDCKGLHEVAVSHWPSSDPEYSYIVIGCQRFEGQDYRLLKEWADRE